MEKDSELLKLVNSRPLIKGGLGREVPLSQRGLQLFLACSTSKALWLARQLTSIMGHARQMSKFNHPQTLPTPLRAVEIEAVRNGNQIVWAFVYEKDAAAMRNLFVHLLNKHKHDKPWLKDRKNEENNQEELKNYAESL